MDALDCSDYRSFWMSWAKGFFDVAVGSAFGTRILEWYDSNPIPVHTLSLKTGMGFSGDWRIPRLAGNHLSDTIVEIKDKSIGLVLLKSWFKI